MAVLDSFFQYLLLDQEATDSGSSVPVAIVGPTDSASFFLNVISLNGTSPSVQVYLQHSPDNGTTWLDFIAFNAAIAPSVQTAPWSRRIAGYTPGLVMVVGSGILMPGTIINGPIAHSMVRVVWMLTGTSPAALFSVWALLSGSTSI